MASTSLSAQTTWQPSSGHAQIPIWPRVAPDPQPVKGPEFAEEVTQDLVAGRPWVALSNVSQPTMTVYRPSGQNTGVAVIVYPGGGYEILAIDLEGTEICDWLTSKGITCVLLKYRVPASRSEPNWGAYPQSVMALEDAQRTMGLVRLHAIEWGIDPKKVGVLGFSAGGHLAAAISTHFDKRLYPSVDDADKESCRPDFAVPIYPGHLTFHENTFVLNPAVPVTRETPPTLLLQAEDDRVDGVDQALTYYIALKKAEVPVEMHLYAHGGHAFGLRHTEDPITDWPELVEKWLRTIRMISE